MESAAYFDIDVILAEQEKVFCIANDNLQGLGFLTGSAALQDLPYRARLELPFWLAFSLAERDVFSMESLPRCFQARVINDLRADPTVVNLHDLCPHFYRLGMIMVQLISSPDVDLKDVLSETLKQRMQVIMDRTIAMGSRSSAKSSSARASAFEQRLDETEKKLYANGLKAQVASFQWYTRNKGEARIKVLSFAGKNPVKRVRHA